MPHRLFHLGNDLSIFLAGIGAFVIARISHWVALAQVATTGQADPGSVTDVVGAGGLTVSVTTAIVIAARALPQGLAIMAEIIKTIATDREKVREEKNRDRLEAMAVREHDAKLTNLEAELAKVRKESAEERDRIRQEAAAQVEEAKKQASDALMKYREIRHGRDDDLNARVNKIEHRVEISEKVVSQVAERLSGDDYSPVIGQPPVIPPPAA